MLRFLVIAWIAASGIASTVVVDRIAVTVGKSVITSSEVEQEIRVTAFLNGDPLDLSEDARRKAAERLVDQKLIRNDMNLSNWPQPETSEASKMLAQVKRERFGGDEARYRKALADYGIDEGELLQHLLWQIAALRYTDYRFRPDISGPDRALRQHLEQKTETRSEEAARRAPTEGQIRLGQARQRTPRTDEDEKTGQASPPAPPLPPPRANGAKPVPPDVDQQMDAWLKEARERARIVYHPEALR